MEGQYQQRYLNGRGEQPREGEQVMWLSNSPQEANVKKEMWSYSAHIHGNKMRVQYVLINRSGIFHELY